MPTTRAGRYRILETLGAGGMGQVFRCIDETTGQLYAIKFLRADREDDPELRSRFEREIEALRQLEHPHIVHLVDEGQQDGRRYYVMTLLSQGSLGDLLERHERLPLAFSLRIARQLASALGFAHLTRRVHRDVKPSNVRFDVMANAQLIDFGLAKALDDPSVALTRDGTMLGTLSYMAPEQLRGEPATPLSDIYQLGVVLYEMLTGKLPRSGGDVLRALAETQTPPLVPPSELSPEVPPEVDELVARLLATDPAQRPQTAEEAALLLAECGAAMRSGMFRTGMFRTGMFRSTRPTRAVEARLAMAAALPERARAALHRSGAAAIRARDALAASRPVRTAFASCLAAGLVIVLGLRCELPAPRRPHLERCTLTPSVDATDLVLEASEPSHAFVELATAGHQPSVIFNRQPGTKVAFRGLPVIPGRVYQVRVWLARQMSFPADGSLPEMTRTFRAPAALMPPPGLAQASAPAEPSASAQEAAALLKDVQPPARLTFAAGQ